MSDNSEYGTVVKNMFRISVSEIYSLQDYLLNKGNVTSFPVIRQDTDYGSTSNGGTCYLLNEKMSLPSAFEMEYTVYRTSTNYSWNYVLFGDKTARYDVGQLRGSGSLSIRKMPQDSMVADRNSSIIGTYTTVVVKYTYNNGSQSLSANNTVISGTDSSISPSFLGFYKTQDTTITNIKIKPL